MVFPLPAAAALSALGGIALGVAATRAYLRAPRRGFNQFLGLVVDGKALRTAHGSLVTAYGFHPDEHREPIVAGLLNVTRGLSPGAVLAHYALIEDESGVRQRSDWLYLETSEARAAEHQALSHGLGLEPVDPLAMLLKMFRSGAPGHWWDVSLHSSLNDRLVRVEDRDGTRFVGMAQFVPRRGGPEPYHLPAAGFWIEQQIILGSSEAASRLATRKRLFLLAGLDVLGAAAGRKEGAGDAFAKTVAEAEREAFLEPMAAGSFTYLCWGDEREECEARLERAKASLIHSRSAAWWREVGFLALAAALPGACGKKRTSMPVVAPQETLLTQSALTDWWSGAAEGEDSLGTFRSAWDPKRRFKLPVPNPPIIPLVGPSGAGKSTVLAFLALEAAQRGAHVLYFDFGRSALMPLREAGFTTWNWDDSGLDPFAVQDELFVEVFLRGLLGDLGEEAQAVETIREAVAMTLNDDRRDWSSFERYCRREDVLTSLRRLPEVFRRPLVLPADRLALHVELEGVGEVIGQEYLGAAILLLVAAAEARMKTSDAEPLRGLVVVDEAWFAFKNAWFRRRLLEWSRTLRKARICLVLATQVAADVPPEMLVNTGYRMYGRDPTGDEEVYSAHAVKAEDLRRLPPFCWLVKTAGNSAAVKLELTDHGYDLLPPKGKTIREWIAERAEK